MSFRTLSWNSTTRLSCVDCLPADVILCLSDGLVAQKNCPLDPMVDPETTPQDDYPYNTIDAQIVSFTRIAGACGTAMYHYGLSFDDSQLLPEVNLVCSNILGAVCRQCLTTYIDEKVGNEIRVEYVTIEGADKIRITTQHGCVFEFDKPITGCAWGFTGDQNETNVTQFVDCGQIVEVVGGVATTTTATAPRILTIDVDISSDAGNILTTGGDGGLFVPPDASSAFDLDADTGIAETINAGDTLMIAGGTAISTAVGAPDTVTVNLDISSDAGNILTTGGDGGAFVPPNTFTSFAVTADTGTNQTINSGNTLDIEGGASIDTVVGATDKVTVALDLSDDAGQLLGFGTDGSILLTCSDISPCMPALVYALTVSAGDVGSGLPMSEISVNHVNPSASRTMYVTGGYLCAVGYETQVTIGGGGPILRLNIDRAGVFDIATMIGANSAVGDGITGTYFSSDFIDGRTLAPSASDIFYIQYGATLPNGDQSIGSWAEAIKTTGVVI